MAALLKISAGDYLSDGERLVQVRSVSKKGWIRVVGMDEVSFRVEADEVTARWWHVKPDRTAKEIDDEVNQWVECHYPLLSRREMREADLLARKRCSCSRCLAYLAGPEEKA